MIIGIVWTGKYGFVLFPVRTNFIIPKFFAIFVRHLLLILKSMMKKRFLFAFILFLISVLNTYAGIELRSRQMKTSDGLPSNSVRYMYQDMIFMHNFKLKYFDVCDYHWTEVDNVDDLLNAKQIHLTK